MLSKILRGRGEVTLVQKRTATIQLNSDSAMDPLDNHGECKDWWQEVHVKCMLGWKGARPGTVFRAPSQSVRSPLLAMHAVHPPRTEVMSIIKKSPLHGLHAWNLRAFL